jgi:glycosyltransferase involved in cell wall biosynthesis
MLDSQPKFTIITTSFNRSALAEHCIRSVLLQSYSNIEYFVIDNGSSEPLDELIESLNDPRIIYTRHVKNQCLNHLLNTTFEHATGDYLLWLQDDDALTPNALEIVAEYLVVNASAEILFGGYARYNHDTGRVYPEQGACGRDSPTEPWQENSDEILGTIGAYFGLNIGPSKAFTIPATPTTSYFSVDLLSRVRARQTNLWIPPYGDHSLMTALLYEEKLHIIPAILGLVGDTVVREQTDLTQDRYRRMESKTFRDSNFLYKGLTIPNCQATSLVRAYACHVSVTSMYKLLLPKFFIRHAFAILNDTRITKRTIRDLFEVFPDAARSCIHFGLAANDARDLALLLRRIIARCGGSALKRWIAGNRISQAKETASEAFENTRDSKRFSSILECIEWINGLNPPANWRTPLPDIGNDK